MLELQTMHKHPALLVPDQVLLPDGPRRDYAVLVKDGVIADVGPLPRLQAVPAERLDLPGRLLMPGFIDAHHHLTQTFGKALVFGEPSEIFRRVWVPMERHMDAEAIETAARLAAWESLRGGFTTVVDAGARTTEDLGIIADVTHEVGLRCVLGMVCNDLEDGHRVANKEQILAGAEQHLDRWHEYPTIHPSLAVSIPEAASDQVLAAVAGCAREAAVPFQTHLNEHLVAVERSVKETGMRPVERLAHLGALGPELLAAHATMLTAHEITLLRDSGCAISYNPVASSWKGNAIAPALLLDELGVRIGLGTDGTRSDAFRLLDAAETAQRFGHSMAVGDSSAGDGWTWLDQALRGSADATWLDRKIGEIVPGAYADLLVVDVDTPELVPSWNLPWELVRLVNRDQIESVIVHGRLRLTHGRPVDWDGNKLLQRAREIAADVVAASPIHTVNGTQRQARRQTGDDRSS